MHLELRPCPPSEFTRAVTVENRAWHGDTMSSVLYPGPFPENRPAIRAQEMTQEMETEPANRWYQVVDTDPEAEFPDQAIAVAKWQIYQDKLPGPRQNRQFGQGCNAEACQKFFADLAGFREKYVGDKHCIFLQILTTDPSYARRGAGGMLLKWGIDLSEELGLPIFLESSPKGHALYLKYGFEDLECYEPDWSQYGATEPHRLWLMMYHPKAKESS